MAQLVNKNEYRRAINRISGTILWPRVAFFYDFEDLEDHWDGVMQDEDYTIRDHMKRAGFTWDNW